MNRMSSVTWGCAIAEGKRSGELGREVEDDGPLQIQDDRFNHLCRLIGPSRGWYWIPKGRLWCTRPV